MTDYTIRKWKPEDKEMLKVVWKDGFGDTDEFIERFHEHFLNEENECILAEKDGRIISAVYLLKDIYLYPHRKDIVKAGYIYAFATLKEYRGQGIGAAVYQEACKAGYAAGLDAICVLPAEESLIPYYERIAGTRPLSAIRQSTYSKEEIHSFTSGMAARIEYMEYASIRRGYLNTEPYAMYPEGFYEWHLFLDKFGSTDFFVTEDGIAATETENGICRVKELIVPDGNEEKALASIARFAPAEKYIVNAPAFYDGKGEIKRFVDISFREEPRYSLDGDLWWGLAFD